MATAASTTHSDILYALCENAMKYTFERWHIRAIAHDTDHLCFNGGIPSYSRTLCGGTLDGGWDVRVEVNPEKVAHMTTTTYSTGEPFVCAPCATAYLSLHGVADPDLATTEPTTATETDYKIEVRGPMDKDWVEVKPFFNEEPFNTLEAATTWFDSNRAADPEVYDYLRVRYVKSKRVTTTEVVEAHEAPIGTERFNTLVDRIAQERRG